MHTSAVSQIAWDEDALTKAITTAKHKSVTMNQWEHEEDTRNRHEALELRATKSRSALVPTSISNSLLWEAKKGESGIEVVSILRPIGSVAGANQPTEPRAQ